MLYNDNFNTLFTLKTSRVITGLVFVCLTLSQFISDLTPQDIYGRGLSVLFEPELSADAETVNVIFVHGLRDSVEETWTHTESQSFWPLWLPENKMFKNTRILIFNHNAFEARAYSSSERFSFFAEWLLTELDFLGSRISNVSPHSMKET